MDKEAKTLFETSAWITTYLLGNISEEDEEKLRLWLNESEHHREIFDMLCDEVINHKRIALYTDDAPERAYRLFLKRQHSEGRKMQFVRWWKYVAIFLLPMCLGGYLWWNISKTSEKSEGIYMAEKSADHLPVITLSNGKQVVLKQAALTLNDIHGTKVAKLDSNGLVYSGKPVVSEALEYHVLQTPAQCDYTFVLSDGTKVWVNAKTTLKYPVVFGKNERVIQVKGEIYLEVAKEADRPFYVMTDDLKVRVLGTSFNVKSYQDDSYTAVTLMEGKVAAEIGDKAYTLFPNHQLYFERTNAQVTLSKVDVMDFVAWRTGSYVFNGQTLGEVCKVLQRWYDVEIVFERPECGRRIYTGIVYKEEKIEDFIRNLNISSGYHCRYEHGKIVIR